MLINVDHGTIPAATVVMKEDLDLDNVSLGILGSLVFLGLALGKILFITSRINECHISIHLYKSEDNNNVNFHYK